jgi:hypothetical protein
MDDADNMVDAYGKLIQIFWCEKLEGGGQLNF